MPRRRREQPFLLVEPQRIGIQAVDAAVVQVGDHLPVAARGVLPHLNRDQGRRLALQVALVPPAVVDPVLHKVDVERRLVPDVLHEEPADAVGHRAALPDPAPVGVYRDRRIVERHQRVVEGTAGGHCARQRNREVRAALQPVEAARQFLGDHCHDRRVRRRRRVRQSLAVSGRQWIAEPRLVGEEDRDAAGPEPLARPNQVVHGLGSRGPGSTCLQAAAALPAPPTASRTPSSADHA